MRKTLLVLSIMVAASLLNTTAFAAVANDEVTSIKLKEADGTSGQNTNSGSGVKTGHIQNDAVTTGKIANGAVTDAKITGPISGSKLGTHTHNGSDVVDGTISTSKIQDGAVTDAKIIGPISGSKISSTGLNADTVDGQHASAFATASHAQAMSTVTDLEAALAGKSDVTHNHDTLYQQKYGKVAVVAQTGGDYTSPVLAMNDVATWCGTPSATNPCLVKIMPGVYSIGSANVQMMPYVDIEGSGENVTKITGGSFLGTVIGASYAELRLLTVEAIGGLARGISNSSASPSIRNVTVRAFGSGSTIGIMNIGSSPTIIHVTIAAYDTAMGGVTSGVLNNGSSPIMNYVTVTASQYSGACYGVMNTMSSSPKIANMSITITTIFGINYGIMTQENSSATLNNVTITVAGSSSCGIAGYDYTATITIDNSAIKGPVGAICNTGTMYIGHTKIDGPVSNGGALKCIGVFDGNYDSVTCQ